MFVLGRNVSLDESSVACRSKYGRDLICFNPTKPGGKYHFRLYVLTAADNWFMFNFRIHCKDLVEHRIVDEAKANQFASETESCSGMRKLVLEVCQPIFGTKRIVNMDNLYSSPQLLEQLYLKGLYARGTTRMNRRHAPNHLVFTKRDLAVYPRGSVRYGVCSSGVNRPLVFASWIDGNVVNIISNVDSTEIAEVKRTYGAVSKTYEAPQIVQQYNKFMQGVDRVDQMRARFSIADGHSFKKYYKKLAVALFDLARVNAYKARMHVLSQADHSVSARRDPHRSFVTDLANDLITGAWKKVPIQSMMDTADENDSLSSSSSLPIHGSFNMDGCTAAQIQIHEMRRKRQCVVCRWENRIIGMKTLRDVTHNVALCFQVQAGNELRPYMCPDVEWTCWKKFHDFYLPQNLYNFKGNICSSCPLYKLRKQVEGCHLILKY